MLQPDDYSGLLKSISLDFEVKWDLDTLFEEVSAWLFTPKRTEFSHVGVMCSPEFADLVKGHVPEQLLVDCRTMLLSISLAYCYDGLSKKIRTRQKMDEIGAVSGSRLLQNLEHHLVPGENPLGYGSQHPDGNKALKARFLLCLAAVVGIYYTAPPCSSPEFPIFDTATGQSRPSTLWHAMKDHLSLMLAHHLVLLGQRLRVALPADSEKAFLRGCTRLWTKLHPSLGGRPRCPAKASCWILGRCRIRHILMPSAFRRSFSQTYPMMTNSVQRANAYENNCGCHVPIPGSGQCMNAFPIRWIPSGGYDAALNRDYSRLKIF